MADGHITAATIEHPHSHADFHHAQRDSLTHHNADLSPVCHGSSYIDFDTNAPAGQHRNAITHADAHCIAHANTYAHVNGDAHPNAHGYRDLNSDVNAHAHRHAAALQRQLSSR